jgi:hypothetical protein
MSKKYIADIIEIGTNATIGGNTVITTASGYATTNYVDNAISGLVNSAPATLDTLNELATALGNDASFSTTVTNSIGTKWTQDNTKISNWDTAYGWGNHAGLYSLLGHTHSYLPLSGGTLTGTLTINSAVAFNLTNTGTGTYDKTVVYNDDSNGLLIEGAWATDGLVTRNPITLTWRGGLQFGGLKLNGDTKLYTNDSGLGIDEANPIAKLTLPLEEESNYKIAFKSAGTTHAGISTVDQSGAGLYVGANSYVNASGTVVPSDSAYPSFGMYLDGWSSDEIKFYTAASGTPTNSMSLTSSGVLVVGNGVRIGTTTNYTSQTLQVNGFIDQTDTSAAFRLYDGSTFIGGIGNGNWAFGATWDGYYSIYGNSSKLLFNAGGGNSPTMVLDDNGNLGIGTTSPGVKLDVDGTTRATRFTLDGAIDGNFGYIEASWGGDLAYPTLYGSHPDRWVMHINPHISYVQNGVNGFTGSSEGAKIRFASDTNAPSAWDIGIGANGVGADRLSIGRESSSYLAIDNGGKVGIGTASPSSKLQVETSASSPFRMTRTGGGGVFGFELGNGEAGFYNYGTTSYVWYAKSNGNLGIGVTSPSAKLDVHTSGSNGIYGRGNGGNLNIENTNTSTTEGGWMSISGYVGNGVSQYPMAAISANKQTAAADGDYGGCLTLWTTAGYGVAGEANSGMYERMRIDKKGNVGIGTTSPDTKIHISGDSASRNTIVNNVTIDGGISVPNPYDGFGFGITFQGRDYGNAIRDYAYISSVIEDQSSSAGGGDAGFKAGLRFYTNKGGSSTANPTEAMRIDSSGNVGINCNPNAKLEVKGNLKIQRSSNIETSEITMESGNFDVKSAPYGYPIVFHTGTGGSYSERMRITSGGYLKASNDGTYSAATATFHEIRTNAANSYIARFDNTTATNSGFAGINIRYTSLSIDANSNSFLVCEDSTTVRMRVYSDGDVWTSDAGTLTSDETLKRDIVDATPKLDDIMKLRVRNYYWREDYHPNKQDQKLIGFIAQEFEEVFPNMVSEHIIKDAEYETIEHPAVEATYEVIEHAEELDEEGNVIKEAWTEEIELTPAQDAWTETTDVLISEEVRKKGIKEGKLIPILVKAMQEQQEMIKELQARIAALEAR